jgi:OsmC-like protein
VEIRSSPGRWWGRRYAVFRGLLLAALAACQEVTLRMVAANLGLDLTLVEVIAEGDCDPRGTLAMGREFPIGLTAIRCSTSVRLA